MQPQSIPNMKFSFVMAFLYTVTVAVHLWVYVEYRRGGWSSITGIFIVFAVILDGLVIYLIIKSTRESLARHRGHRVV